MLCTNFFSLSGTALVRLHAALLAVTTHVVGKSPPTSAAAVAGGSRRDVSAAELCQRGQNLQGEV